MNVKKIFIPLILREQNSISTPRNKQKKNYYKEFPDLSETPDFNVFLFFFKLKKIHLN